MLYALEAPERLIQWARSSAENQTLPNTAADFAPNHYPKTPQALPVRSAELEKEIEVSTKTVPAAFIDTGGAASPGLGEGSNPRNH